MADWTNLPNQAVGVGGLPSGTTVTALRDNPVAIAEGAPGAPRIEQPAIGNWYYSVGGVGTYALLWDSVERTNNQGQTRAGSQLRYSGGQNNYRNSSPSGTWRVMGVTGYSIGSTEPSAAQTRSSLWLRIS